MVSILSEKDLQFSSLILLVFVQASWFLKHLVKLTRPKSSCDLLSSLPYLCSLNVHISIFSKTNHYYLVVDIICDFLFIQKYHMFAAVGHDFWLKCRVSSQKPHIWHCYTVYYITFYKITVFSFMKTDRSTDQSDWNVVFTRKS